MATDGGIECPSCACRHHYTVRTSKINGKIRRRRECRHCGKRFNTYETLPADQPQRGDGETTERCGDGDIVGNDQ